MFRKFAIIAVVGVACLPLLTRVAAAQTQPAPLKPESGAPVNPPVRVRGTIMDVRGHTMTLATKSGPVPIQFTTHSHLLAVLPSDVAHVKPKAYIGVTSVELPNGTQRAVEIHVFPDNMRGSGEGSRPWDWPGTVGASAGPRSRMTNGTITAMPTSAIHSRMTNGTVKVVGGSIVVSYQDRGAAGMQSILFPPNIPIVTFGQATPKDVKPGAKVVVMAMRLPNGDLAAVNILVGKNGITPPM